MDEIEITVDGVKIRGQIVVLCKRILAVEMVLPIHADEQYGERISPADAERGIVYCDGFGHITDRGRNEAKRVLAEQFRRLKR